MDTLRQHLECILGSSDRERELQALLFASSWLRGFDQTDRALELYMQDASVWVSEHGAPTVASLRSWLDGLGVEADIPAPAALRNLSRVLHALPVA